eukprot:scaffold80602_cov59-Phaeocystis_antarctica.AAC.2
MGRRLVSSVRCRESSSVFCHSIHAARKPSLATSVRMASPLAPATRRMEHRPARSRQLEQHHDAPVGAAVRCDGRARTVRALAGARSLVVLCLRKETGRNVRCVTYHGRCGSHAVLT